MSVIDTKTHSVIATVPVEESPDTITITPDGKLAYVLFAVSDDSFIAIIDTKNHSIIATVLIGVDEDSINAVYFTPDGKLAYVTNAGSQNVSVKVGVAAPRSHAKSSFLLKAYPIHEVVYRLRKYIIIISETLDVSSANMDWISNQLKYNEKLRASFGPLLDPELQGNEKDNSSEFIAWHPIVGEQHRRERVALVPAGRNWDGNRPDSVICDDLEDANTNASTPELWKKLRECFTLVVMPLGDPKGELTAYVYMGTTVHHDALLMNILHKRSYFRTRIYRSMIEQPKNMALREQCRGIYQDRNNANRSDEALKFYDTNHKEMDEGADVLWRTFSHCTS
ncbi:hypothetical protein ACSVDA_02325 [Cytobacillus sp. Hm23]